MPDSQLPTPIREYLNNSLAEVGEYEAPDALPDDHEAELAEKPIPVKVKRQTASDSSENDDDNSDDQSPARMMPSPADPEERRLYQKRRVAENGRKHRERYKQAYLDQPELKKKIAQSRLVLK